MLRLLLAFKKIANNETVTQIVKQRIKQLVASTPKTTKYETITQLISQQMKRLISTTNV